MRPMKAVKIGISSCLLGENVRYDARNKYNSLIVETLGPYVQFMPVCPETGIGLGTPRPPLKLVEINGRVSAVGVDNPATDVTQDLADFGKTQATLLNTVCGYIFKSRSPSCGLTDTPITTDGEEIKGPGLYTRQIVKALPLLPVTDEASLRLEESASNFLERVFACRRWQLLMERPVSAASLRNFHRLHAPELNRRRAACLEELEELLFYMKDPLQEETILQYRKIFMTALEIPAAISSKAEQLFASHVRLVALLDNHAD